MGITNTKYLVDHIGNPLTSIVNRAVTDVAAHCPLGNDVHCKGESGRDKVSAWFSNQTYTRALWEVSVKRRRQLITDLNTKR